MAVREALWKQMSLTTFAILVLRWEVARAEAIEYIKRVDLLIKRLLQVLMKRLNVKDIDKMMERLLMGATRLHFNYYPKCPNPELTAGVGRHSDISTITILLQDDSGGLYVRREGSEFDSWIHVPPATDALVINIGDVLQIMSNGLYKSVEHRALPNKNRSRISIPTFVSPEPDALIGPQPQVLETGEKPTYKQVLYLDYFNHFFSKPPDGKKVIEFAKILLSQINVIWLSEVLVVKEKNFTLLPPCIIST
ncbi:hypothetical protein TIFTF001_055049 [Ficus carica]|uniref:Fe2OG dioxygenase domain-containing protein n=1 Tax=Ficus carica TaxID=3494 RepID=A0AA88JBE4_FICCA|nr:hypothetical protein TIFTF001_055049 [Ficus carica]